MCGPHRRFAAGPIRHIPQAIGTVATADEILALKPGEEVSIPQAVSAVATCTSIYWPYVYFYSFNTASGKCCCNRFYNPKLTEKLYECFNTASGKCCCNLRYMKDLLSSLIISFNTASGKCCCNYYTETSWFRLPRRFNTASGKCCCNSKRREEVKKARTFRVSIPQAVSAVATLLWIYL